MGLKKACSFALPFFVTFRGLLLLLLLLLVIECLYYV